MYILFDIGGTHLRLACSINGSTLAKTEVFPTPQNFDEALEVLKTQITNISEGKPIKAILGGIAGRLNGEKTEIIRASNLPDWSGKPLAKNLADMFQCAVKMENDCAVGALGENQFGIGKEYKNIIYVAAGTGIGGAWILNNELVQGSYSYGIGHQIIDPNGPLCPGCRQPGHLEAYLDHPDFKKYFTIGLYNTMLHWPADVIILGGGVVLSNNWNALVIETEIKELSKHRGYNMPVKITALGDEVGLYGALTLIPS